MASKLFILLLFINLINKVQSTNQVHQSHVLYKGGLIFVKANPNISLKVNYTENIHIHLSLDYIYQPLIELLKLLQTYKSVCHYRSPMILAQNLQIHPQWIEPTYQYIGQGPYIKAQQMCANKGGRLPEIRTTKQQTTIFNLVNHLQINEFPAGIFHEITTKKHFYASNHLDLVRYNNDSLPRINAEINHYHTVSGSSSIADLPYNTIYGIQGRALVTIPAYRLNHTFNIVCEFPNLITSNVDHAEEYSYAILINKTCNNQMDRLQIKVNETIQFVMQHLLDDVGNNNLLAPTYNSLLSKLISEVMGPKFHQITVPQIKLPPTNFDNFHFYTNNSNTYSIKETIPITLPLSNRSNSTWLNNINNRLNSSIKVSTSVLYQTQSTLEQYISSSCVDIRQAATQLIISLRNTALGHLHSDILPFKFLYNIVKSFSNQFNIVLDSTRGDIISVIAPGKSQLELKLTFKVKEADRILDLYTVSPLPLYSNKYNGKIDIPTTYVAINSKLQLFYKVSMFFLIIVYLPTVPFLKIT